MLRYDLSSEALEVARLCGDAMADLAETIQSALTAIFEDRSDAAAPIERDHLELVTQSRRYHQAHVDLYATWVLLPVVTRCNHIMDSLLGMHVLAQGAVVHGNPTAMAPSVLARTILETGVTAAYHLEGTLEDRLLRAYAGQLRELGEAIRAGKVSPVVTASALADLEHEYLECRALHTDLGYTIVPATQRSMVAGEPAVKAVQTRDGNVRAPLRTQTTERIARQGEHWLGSWHLGSGINHGLIWAIQGQFQRLERGETRGELFIAAAASASQGCQSLLTALSEFTGISGPVHAAEDIVGGLGVTFSQMGIPSRTDVDSSR